jgi:hypothetical protein
MCCTNSQVANCRYSTNKEKKKEKSAYNYFSEDKFQQVVTQDIYIKIIIVG